jgi:hypothetical protein
MNIAQQVKDIFGYDRSALGWYRDFALGVTSGISLIFGVVFALVAHSRRGSSFDLNVSLGCFAVVVLCILVSPQKSTVFAGTIATPAAFVLLKFMTTGALRPLLVFLGLMLLLGVAGAILGLIQWYRRQR